MESNTYSWTSLPRPTSYRRLESQIDPRITDPNNPVNSIERYTPAVLQPEHEALRVSPRKNRGKRKAATPTANELEQPTGPKKRTPRIKLSPAEDLALIQYCLKYSDTYGRSKSDAAWWNAVGNKFNRSFGKNFTNHKRRVNDLVKTRKLFLEMLQTGDEDEKGPFIDAITQWIKITDGYEDQEATRKKTQQEIDTEDERATDLRANMTKVLSQKKRDRPETSESDSSSDISSVGIVERQPEGPSYNTSPPLATLSPGPGNSRINQIRQSTSASTPSPTRSVPPSSFARNTSRSSRERSRAPRLTAAKKARLQAEANQTAVGRLAEVLAKVLVNRFEGGESTPEVNRRLEKLVNEADEARKARQLMDKKMDRILLAIGALTAAQSS